MKNYSVSRNFVIMVFGILCSHLALGQTLISGKVTDVSGNPVSGANIYLEGTYDGASTDMKGTFRFETTEIGTQTLVISMLGYETLYETGDIAYLKDLELELRETVNQLNAVTLTAGTFEAGDNSKASVLKPLDIVTTAGAVGDFAGALQTLPGTSTVNEDGRLFVRGGDAGETQVFIDGLRVFQPFNATANNVPTRGRFSPFLFKGTTFSTGGYSAEYGQALSSVLLLNTIDVPVQEKTDISIMSVGGGIGHTEIWGDRSLSLNTQYINLAPYEALIPSDQGIRLNKPYTSFAGEAVFREKGENGLFKLYTSFNRADLDVEQEDINFEEFVAFRLTNRNLYFNSSYKHFFPGEWTLRTGASVSWDDNDIGILEDAITVEEQATHLKANLKKTFSNRFSLTAGGEIFFTDNRENFKSTDGMEFDSGFNDRLTAGFLEGDIYFSSKLALKLGMRGEHSDLISDFTVSPRASLAYKSSENGQFSLAYGQFYQSPRPEALRYASGLDFENTSHYILNYQYIKAGKTLRAEAYYKDYRNLLKFDTEIPRFDSDYTNNGSGYATGLDIFWRDDKSIDNLEYWVSYGYLDTRRDFRNFQEKATPNFAPRHNLSVVTKYWIDDLKSQVGVSYAYASGRPYDDPNTPEFLAERTKSFNSLNLTWAYLIDQQKILNFSVNNVLGFNNVSNYQYANAPDARGTFQRRAVRTPADSFFFVGFFWTISSDKKSNQLDNL